MRDPLILSCATHLQLIQKKRKKTRGNEWQKKNLCGKNSFELLNMFYVCSAVLNMQILYKTNQMFHMAGLSCSSELLEVGAQEVKSGFID